MNKNRIIPEVLLAFILNLFISGFALSLDLPEKLFHFSSLKTRFIQEKKLKAFSQILKTEGSLLVLKPSFILWKADSPVQFTFLVRDQEVTYKDEDMESPKIFSVKENPALKESLPLFNLLLCREPKDLEKYFTLSDIRETGKEADLTLVPKSAGENTLFSLIRVKINREEGKLLRIEFLEDNGDTSTLSFTETELNPSLTSQDFRLE